MKTILALVAIAAGGWLVYAGYQRQESLAGKTESVMSDLGRKLDGETRVPEHVWLYAGGALLIGGGLAGVAWSRRRA